MFRQAELTKPGYLPNLATRSILTQNVCVDNVVYEVGWILEVNYGKLMPGHRELTGDQKKSNKRRAKEIVVNWTCIMSYYENMFYNVINLFQGYYIPVSQKTKKQKQRYNQKAAAKMVKYRKRLRERGEQESDNESNINVSYECTLFWSK